MASADPPTIATLHHRDDPTTPTCPRLPDGHPAVQESKKMTFPTRRTSDIVDSGPSSAWRVPPPPPEPPPPPQPPPPPWCPPSLFPPIIDSGFQQRPAPQLLLGSHTAQHQNGTVVDPPGLSSAWHVPPPDPPPPHPPEPPSSLLTPAPIPPWPPPAPWPWQISSIRPLAIAMPCRYAYGTSADRTSALPSSLPILSLLHPHLWGLSRTELRDAPPSANAPYHCASFRANGTNMAPLPPSVEFTFGTSAPSFGHRAASSSFIFLPPSTTFHEPLPMVFGRHSINNRAQDATSARTIRRFKVRTAPHRSKVRSTPQHSPLPMASPSRAATQMSIPSSSSAPSIHHRKKNYMKFLWRTGVITKSSYTDFCSRLNSLHHSFRRGEITSCQLKAQIEELCDYFKPSPGSSTPSVNQAAARATTRRPVPPPSLTPARCCSYDASRGLHNNQWRRRTWRRKENRVVLGGSSLPRLMMAWGFWFSAGAELLNRKRHAVSVALEAARILKTTQRLIPFPRRRPSSRSIWGAR